MCGGQADILITIPPQNKQLDSLDPSPNHSKLGIAFKSINDNDLKNINSLKHHERLMNLSHSMWGVRSVMFSLHEYEILLANTGVVAGIRKRCSEFIKRELRAMGYESEGLGDGISDDFSDEDN